MVALSLRACPVTKSLIFLAFRSGLDRRMSLFQVSGTVESGSVARQNPNLSSGWSYRTGSETLLLQCVTSREAQPCKAAHRRYGNLPLGLSLCLHRRLTLHSIAPSILFGRRPDAEPRVKGLHWVGFVLFQRFGR